MVKLTVAAVCIPLYAKQFCLMFSRHCVWTCSAYSCHALIPYANL